MKEVARCEAESGRGHRDSAPSAHLHCTHQLGAFTDALLDVTPLLVRDGRVLRRAIVGR